MMFTIPDGYLGDCARCHAPATHAEFVPFDPPLPASGDFPAVTGVWHHVCDEHCDRTAKHEEVAS